MVEKIRARTLRGIPKAERVWLHYLIVRAIAHNSAKKYVPLLSVNVPIFILGFLPGSVVNHPIDALRCIATVENSDRPYYTGCDTITVFYLYLRLTTT